MSTDDRKRKFALAGGLFGAAHLASHSLPTGPAELLMGLAAGLGMVLLASVLLPEAALARVRRWKRRE